MPPVRIAMWSGPRNISTAMMRAFDARADCSVTDEPLYAHYLATTGADHPARDHIIAAHEPDWRRVASFLAGPVPRGRAIWYQKHMAHHLTPEVDRGWIAGLSSAMLIRDPEEMITSYIHVLPSPGPRDLGLPQQAELFELIRDSTGVTPPVVDARDVLERPGPMLAALCAALGIPDDPGMLRWDAGARDTDGVWASHWYATVLRSTGFQPYAPKPERAPSRLAGVLRECRALYDRLSEHRIG